MQTDALVRCLIGVADEQEKTAIVGAGLRLVGKAALKAGKHLFTKPVTVGGKKVLKKRMFGLGTKKVIEGGTKTRRFAPGRALGTGFVGLETTGAFGKARRAAITEPGYRPSAQYYARGTRFA